MQVKDQLGRSIQFDRPLKRIISLVPSQTELLVDLGLQQQLVGVTKFCVHPKELRKEKTVIGGTKNINFDKIAALKPDIIIANKEENTSEIVETLGEIAPVWVSDIYCLEDSLEYILAMGALFDKQERAAEIVSKIKGARADFANFMVDKNIKKTAYLIWKQPYMVAGRNTFINALLQDNRFENITTDPESRYPEVSLKELKTSDLILLSSEPYPFKESDRQFLEDQLHKEVILVNGEYFSWYGSRLADAYQYFKRLH